MAEKKEKRYVSDNAQLMSEWDWEKNNKFGLFPHNLTYGSNKKVWWKCSLGHEWQAKICNRTILRRSCPYCSGNKILKGYNDLQTINPSLAKEWNYEKNNGLAPTDVMPNSDKKVWWKCAKGHEWQAIIGNRNKGRGCPYCSGQIVIKGKNDLQTVNPILSQEWNYDKNNGLTPMDVMPNSDKKVWWKCEKGHEWQASIGHRNNGRGCPICDSQQHTSFPEYVLVYYLRKYGIEVKHSYKEKGFELDIYIPSKKSAIEYDGYFWHRNKLNQDLEKNLKCVLNGIKLYRIREELPPLNDSSIDYIVQKNQTDLSKVVEQVLFEIIGNAIDVNIKRDYIDIENLRVHTEKENSLWRTNSQIAKEWNYEKNGGLKPIDFTSNSGKKVWWKCNNGHEWQATIANRSKGTDCPYCSGKKVLLGYNDLCTLNPSLAKEWNYEKNGNLKPTDFTSNSGKKVWWRCNKGHEWQANIYSRNKGSGCPFCSGQKVSAGNNDLLTANPSLAKEWNHEKNGLLKPTDFTANSNKKV